MTMLATKVLSSLLMLLLLPIHTAVAQFCSDSANAYQVCNFELGCFCLPGGGECEEPLGGSSQECNEDLSGGPTNFGACTVDSAEEDPCSPRQEDIDGGCAIAGVKGFCTYRFFPGAPPLCVNPGSLKNVGNEPCPVADGCICALGLCVLKEPSAVDGAYCVAPDALIGDPHMQGLRGQKIDWSGVDGGWYCMIKDDNADLNVNVRLTAPLPDEFPDRQLVTGLTVISEGHSLAIEIENPYAIDTDGCPEGVSPCLANGGLRIVVDGQNVDELLQFSRKVPVADGAISVSASNLPVECRQFGGDKIWARMYQEMLEGERQLRSGESLEEWILRFDHHMAAPGWCAKYIAENDLADLQSTHAIFKIETPAVTVRLNAGVNHQGDGELDWDGRALPDLEFWQMDVGMDGLDVENPVLSGILGETARPVYDKDGQEVMEGFEAFRGTVEDYRVSGALGVHFALLD